MIVNIDAAKSGGSNPVSVEAVGFRALARDRFEPPPSAFSGPPSKRTKRPGISGYH